MQRIGILVIALVALAGRPAYAQAPPRHSEVRLSAAGAAELRAALVATGVVVDHGAWEDTPAGPALRATIPAADVQALRAAGVEVEVLVADVAEEVAARAALEGCPATPYPITGSMGCYPTYSETLAILDQMRAQYPQIVSQRVSIGQTLEGRDVWMVEITDNPGVEEGEPEVLIDGLHHAREAGTVSTVLHAMWDIAESFGTDPEATYLVRNRRMYFVPILNPDGYVYNETTNPAGGGMWRKNRRPNGDGSYGVDLNRNYSFQWGLDDSGSSPNPTSEVYRGTAPFSEPETQVVRDFLAGRQIRVALNFHSFGALWLHAWGYTDAPPPGLATFTRFAQAMTAVNGYTYGPGNTTIYPTNGSSDDFMYGDATGRPAIWAYTPEIGTEGFWPPPSRILPIAEENRRAVYVAAMLAGFTPRADAAYAEVGPGTNGHVDPGETFSVLVTLHNDGAATGEGVSAMVNSTSPHIQVECCPLPAGATIAPGDSAQYGGWSATAAPDAPLGDISGLSVDVFQQGELVGTYPLPPVRIGTPVPVFEDPATALDAWTPAGGWGLAATAWSPPTSFADSPIGNYPANANATLTLSTPLDLTDVLAPRLRFRSRWSIQPDFDFGQVLLSTNGTNWTALPGRYTVPGSGSGAQPAGQHGIEGTNLDWPIEEMDLSPWAGVPAVYIQFRLRSNASTQRDGWWVDDIAVEGLVNGGTTAAEPPADAGAISIGVSPNPTRGPAAFTVRLPVATEARVAVFDALGRRVATLLEGPAPAGVHTLRWDGRGPAGRAAAGVYLVRLDADGRVATSRFSIFQ